MGRPYFPMFIDLTDKKILVVGGGVIALRRIRTMLKFGADIRVIAPQISIKSSVKEEQYSALSALADTISEKLGK